MLPKNERAHFCKHAHLEDRPKSDLRSVLISPFRPAVETNAASEQTTVQCANVGSTVGLMNLVECRHANALLPQCALRALKSAVGSWKATLRLGCFCKTVADTNVACGFGKPRRTESDDIALVLAESHNTGHCVNVSQ